MMENKTEMKQNTGERRVVLYCRVATDTDGGLALKAQKEQLRRYAEEQGYTIVEEITEVTKGSTLRRAGIRRVYQLGYDKAMDFVLTETSSRFARPLNLLLRFTRKLGGYGVQAITCREGTLAALLRPFHSLEE